MARKFKKIGNGSNDSLTLVNLKNLITQAYNEGAKDDTPITIVGGDEEGQDVDLIHAEFHDKSCFVLYGEGWIGD